MAPGGEDRGGRRRRGVALLLAASAWLYGALLALYPKAFRSRYASEMCRDFRELSREGLEEGGRTELARVCASTLSDLAATALKERGTMFARNGYLPVAPDTAARWGALCALLGGLLGAAYSVAYTLAINSGAPDGQPAWWDMRFTPQIFVAATLLSVMGMFGLYGTLVARSGRPGRLALAGVALVAPSVASILAWHAGNFAMRLVWGLPPGDPSEGSYWWFYEWFYGNRILELLGMGCCVTGLSLLGASALRMRLFGRLGALPFVAAALWPASIALFALMAVSGMYHLAPLSGMLPFLGAALSGWVLLNARPRDRLAAAGGAPAAEAAKEKELLEALGRRGALTVAGAALETSLTVDEAERVLSALVAKGHLEVRVERGRLLYSLWEGDAPL